MKYSILFYDNGEPIDIRCIMRFISSFSRSYTDTVQTIIPKSILNFENSEKLEKRFKLNIATLMPSFGMTRVGAFHDLRVHNDGIDDPNQITDLCWKATNKTLQKIKQFVQQTKFDLRRCIVELPPQKENYVIEKISEAFDTLKKVRVKTKEGTHTITRVGASKVLFSVLPEVALPVDNKQWNSLFKGNSYAIILKTMIDEIKKWEEKQPTSLEKADTSKIMTLPSIYNVMAMSARPVNKVYTPRNMQPR